MTMTKSYKAAIFDMDGTILDTIGDLTDAINHTMAHFGHRSDFTPEETKPFFCNGAKFAVSSALAAAQDLSQSQISAEALEEALVYYKPYYAAHSDIKTGPYPGIIECLQKLALAGVQTAVVSNKPDPAVQKLCKVYFPDMFTCSLGEVEGVHRKPAPDMLCLVLDRLGLTAEEAVYVGDSEVDIETAANSGMDCICVDWGFRSRESLIESGAKTIVSSAEELTAAILGQML